MSFDKSELLDADTVVRAVADIPHHLTTVSADDREIGFAVAVVIAGDRFVAVESAREGQNLSVTALNVIENVPLVSRQTAMSVLPSPS